MMSICPYEEGILAALINTLKGEKDYGERGAFQQVGSGLC